MADYKLVPMEPTDEMVGSAIYLEGDIREIWQAMLAAAPVVGEPVANNLDVALKALEAVVTEAHNLPLNWPTDPEARLLWEALNRATFFADEALAQIKGGA